MRMEIYEGDQYIPLFEEVEIVGEAQTYKGAKEVIRLIKDQKKEKPKG